MAEAAIDYAAQGEQGVKRKRTKEDWEEGYKKVRKTIGWYNHNGGMTGGEIIYKSIKDVVENVDPRETLRILKGLEDKVTEIRNPTAWLKSQCLKVGVELDPKVKKVITWFNNQGKLAADIMYKEVRGPLSQLEMRDQLNIINGLEGKEDQIKEPTKWICAAAVRKAEQTGQGSWQPRQSEGKGGRPQQKGSWQKPQKGSGKGGSTGKWTGGDHSAAAKGLHEKVRKTIGWYNRSGLLQAEIRFDEVADSLNAISMGQALEILKGLETKGPEIRNPSNWIIKAAQKLVTG